MVRSVLKHTNPNDFLIFIYHTNQNAILNLISVVDLLSKYNFAPTTQKPLNQSMIILSSAWRQPNFIYK